MMEKIINTMFHGSFKAKVFLWSVFVMILATVLLGVLAAVMGAATFGMGALACGVAAFITSQSVSLQELNKKPKKSPSTKGKKEKSKHASSSHASGDADDGALSPQQEIDQGAPMDSKEKARAKARYLAAMNGKKMKQLMKEHKVKQQHIFVMIDNYPREDVVQTPAVAWQTDTHLHLLVLDAQAREFAVPFEEIKGIWYQKDVPADPENDYSSFQYANFISKMYRPYLPEYREITKGGELEYVKSLFTLEPGISFTNTSVNGLLEILPKVPLMVDDAINTSTHFDEYFKEVYRYSILCKNDVYTLEEYRKKMEEVLEALLVAPITGKEFSKSLRDMNRYHLITSDYVTKYTQIYITKTREK
jgi:hypothetical protein